MARVFHCIIVLTLTLRIRPFNAQPSIQQYLHLTGLSPFYSNIISSIPLAQTVPSFHSNHLPNNPLSLSHVPFTGLPALSGLSIPNLALNLPKSEIRSDINSNIDTTLLNNLAVALQLLIVSNILNLPPSEVDAKSDIIQDVASYGTAPRENVPYYHTQEPIMPISKLVEVPGQIETRKQGRSSMSLMSPYEAMAHSSAPDPFSSQFDSVNAKRELQSPYAMMADTKDVFAMKELFQ